MKKYTTLQDDTFEQLERIPSKMQTKSRKNPKRADIAKMTLDEIAMQLRTRGGLWIMDMRYEIADRIQQIADELEFVVKP